MVKRMISMFVAMGLLTAVLGCTGRQPGATSGAGHANRSLTGQAAVATVFRKIGDDPVFRQFPRDVGTSDGAINIGGPAPGQTISASFETSVTPTGGGAYDVKRIRRWSQSGSTTWTFHVQATGEVSDFVRTGDEPPHIP